MTERTTGPANQIAAGRQSGRAAALGDGAGLLAIGLIGFALLGAAWGLFIPTAHATAAGEGLVRLEGADGAQFGRWLWFVGLVAAGAVALAIAAFSLWRRRRGWGMLLWVAVVAIAGAVVAASAGTLVRQLVHGGADPASAAPGEELTVALPVRIGVAVYLFSSFVATLTYWLLAAFGPGTGDEEDAAVGAAGPTAA